MTNKVVYIVFIYGEFGGHWSFVMKSGQLARSQFCAPRAMCAGMPSCWKMNPVGSRRSLLKNDNLVIIYEHNELLFIKTSL